MSEISQDALDIDAIGEAIRELFPVLPEVPLNQWHRFSFDVCQEYSGVQVRHIRFSKIGEQP